MFNLCALPCLSALSYACFATFLSHCQDFSGSHGHIGHMIISSPLLAIDSLLSPRLPSPSPSLALTSRRHGLPSTPTPSQNAPQPSIDRLHISTAHVAFVPQHPGLVASPISLIPFKMSKIAGHPFSPPLSHPQDTVSGRADRRVVLAVGFGGEFVLSCVIMSRPPPPFDCIFVYLLPFT
ncbi:hypothetical protein EDB85DRAFT_1984782 [Lactarius pseudohatsudake]|nr:hypothetical protein EDB85DRAFT_1984782 [Lactarius pseudohatsudake]